MNLKLIILFVFVSVCSLLISITHHIKQDGTGSFTTIQEGIIAATDSDTILVYPGTYFESINYNNKNITVASLYLSTGDEQYISQTIIDGNNETRCVRIEDCEDIAFIGFTIQNGYAVGSASSGWGGGLLIMEIENGLLSNCKINNNTATLGGGGVFYSSNLTLKSNTISYNRGISQGGGFSIWDSDTHVLFDTLDLNNIYLNYSCTGSDIYIQSPGEYYEIIVDTFTVAEFDEFFIAPYECEASLSAQNYKIEQIDQDLFVSPDGSDANSGLTTDNPLQTIAWAQTLIKRNDENPHTIHLVPGTYSPSLNNQKFPIGIKHGVTYLGSSPENTILDGDNDFTIIEYFYFNNYELPELVINNIGMTNATSSAIKIAKTNLSLKNVIINNCYGSFTSAISSRDGIYNFNNVKIINNNGGQAVRISCVYSGNPEPVLSVHMENSIVQNNDPGQGALEGIGGGLQFGGHLTIPGDHYVSLVNCDISSNYSNYNSAGVAGTTGLYVSKHITADIINCTFGDNTVIDTTGCVITGATAAQVNIYNSIIYDNIGHSCNLWFETEINVYNSLLEGGSDNVGFYYPVNASFNWHEGNLDEDPLWVNSGEYPYMFQSSSPCIDAGTLDLPAGIELPEYDLAGNPRIYGETIDMGAYEWQGVEAEEDEIVQITQTQISNYPNPFNPSTTIKLDLAESGKIELAIFNIKGQKVKTLMDAYSTKGHFEMVWKGIDDNKKKVASGNYLIKLKVNGEEKAISKCVLLK
jgi:hypothetical protein